MLQTKATAYTPEQVAKRIGKLYRISAASLSFFFTGLDYDLYQADLKDRERLSMVKDELIKARAQM